MAENVTNGSGENRNGRAAIDTMVRDLKSSGMPVKKAEQIARETALRYDRGRGARR